LLLLEDPKETKLAKLSLAGVAGFDGGVEECPFDDGGGVGRAWTDGTRIVFIKPELMGGGFLLASLELGVQLRPARSSIARKQRLVGRRRDDEEAL
jgi:hypothetical protein